jgi:NAD(P)H-flavin reductase
MHPDVVTPLPGATRMARDTTERELGPMVPTIYDVVGHRRDLADTVTLTLAPHDEPCADPALGQFNMIWAFGIGEAPISVAGHHDGTLLHTIRAVGAVTESLCSLEPGDQVGVRGPFGVGWDLGRSLGRDVLIVAGGLGLAPVRQLVVELLADREAYGRVTLLVGARSPDALLYRPELAEWRSRLDIEVEVTVDVAPPSWRGDVGVVTRLIDRAPFDPGITTAYICGPEVMMRFAAESITNCGVDAAEIQLSLERNMHCGVGHCGHCQLGPIMVCKTGPVITWPDAEPLMRIRER